MKRVKYWVISLWLLFILLLASPYLYVKYKLFTIEKQVEHYLTHEKAYEPSAISSLKGRFSKLPTFSVLVIFKDEPDITYSYKVENDGRIIQLTPSGTVTKDYLYKHYEGYQYRKDYRKDNK